MNPLSREQSIAVPTTGYEDVRAVALARLALPSVKTIQVDWAQYGPKLAQVALTFGANDLDRVSTVDDESLGRRRTSVEDVKRNIAPPASRRSSPSTRGEAELRRSLRTTSVSPSPWRGFVSQYQAARLRARRPPDLFDVRFDVPAQCAALLHEGRVDLGLIPAIEYLRGDYASCRASRSARTASRVGRGVHREPIERVETLALDLSSRTSVALTRVLCAKRWGIAPKFTPAEPDLEAMLRARRRGAGHRRSRASTIDPAKHDVTKIDLGAEWKALTGLPFVYAMWVGPARRGRRPSSAARCSGARPRRRAPAEDREAGRRRRRRAGAAGAVLPA